MPVKDDLGCRMKEYYEAIPQIRLMRRTPVVIRIDGKAFHTFTKGFDKPFDHTLVKSMQDTMLDLCKNIQGCVFGYTQSDEITLILLDYQTLTTSAYFDYEVQKLCSITASMATLYFNKNFEINVENWYKDNYSYNTNQQNTAYQNAICKGAMFDSRCFNIPKEEVANLIYWRQLDATRNSIQMVGQANFSHKELQGKSCNDIQSMLLIEKNINWNNYEPSLKRGSACYKNPETGWFVDTEMPILKEHWDYINKHIYVGEG
jgi:tRNA(His) 5'-end guanylyltransferase